MLFRRISEHLRAQNWLAVAIDFLIVVIGVFIGIQVANWNEARRASDMEKGYLIRLHEDFSESIAVSQETIDFLQDQITTQSLIISVLQSCALRPEDESDFRRGLATLGLVNPPRMFRRTIDELVSSGRLDLIKSDSLKDRLAAAVASTEFRDNVTATVHRRLEHYRFIVDEHVLYQGGSDLAFDLQGMCSTPAPARAVSALRFITIEREQAYNDLLELYLTIPPAIESELVARWQTDGS